MPRARRGTRRASARLWSSFTRDVRFLALPEISLPDRLRLTFETYAVYARAALGLQPKAAFRFAGAAYHVSCPTDAALLQRVCADTRECLELFGLGGEAGLTLVDVGAHNGETALAWSLFLRDPVIYSFEPDPVSFRHAQRNVGELVAALHEVGLSDQEGKAPFESGRGSGGDATFSLTEHSATGTPVDVARGDDLLAGVRPDLVKIDVEGYERHVLEGAREILARCRFLTIEISLHRPKDHRFHEIAEVLSRARFELVGAGRPHGPDASRPTAIDLHFRRVPDGESSAS